jgi:predicted AAA+ superfamily ATPase
MLLKDTLKSIARSQAEEFSSVDFGIEREKLKDISLDSNFAAILSGVRRCGKSTLLKQLMKKASNFYYFNFEDPRTVNFEVSDFQKLEEIFGEEFGKSNFYFFDEIQNAEKWELFVRTMLDKKKHFFITGSNASLLSKELGTRLTGRHLRFELFPFSFSEFLKFTGKKPGLSSFEEYLRKGGFPEYLKYDKAEILQELLNDILARDIVIRYKLRNLKILKEIAVFLLTNIGKEFSYTNLKKTFNLGSTNTAISFLSYFEDSYLLFTIPKFDYSLKKQVISPKKVYSIDNGLSSVNSASFSADKGKMLENTVFLQLRRQNKEIFYFQQKNECDFLVKQKEKIASAIQVCYELNEDNKTRETNGLIEALEKFNLKQGLILTNNQEDKFETENKKIIIKPTWKWLLETENKE